MITPAWLLILFAVQPASDSLRAGCEDEDAVIAKLTGSETLQVHSAVADGGRSCYSVTAVLNGQPVRGYVIGQNLPAVVSFEKERAAMARWITAGQPQSVAPRAPAPPAVSDAPPPAPSKQPRKDQKLEI